jgi:protein SCO1/2
VLSAALRLAAAAAVAACTLATHAQPAPLRGLTLVDHHDQPLHDAALRARPTLLHFVYTACSSTCPTQVVELGHLQQALPGDVRARLRIVSVTVDPLQDTPASLRTYARRLGADRPGWHFATGEPRQVHALIERMQALTSRAPERENHRTSLYLYDAQGALVQRYAGAPMDRKRLAEEITRITRSR